MKLKEIENKLVKIFTPMQLWGLTSIEPSHAQRPILSHNKHLDSL